MKVKCVDAGDSNRVLEFGKVYDVKVQGAGHLLLDGGGDRFWSMERFEAVPAPKPGPDANPKKAFGDAKPKLALIPPAAEEALAGVLAFGAAKYGEFNWRKNPVEIMTYLHAMKRHIAKVLDGEDIDPESGHPHLGHVMASAAIVLDCMDRGTLIENRPPKKEKP